MDSGIYDVAGWLRNIKIAGATLEDREQQQNLRKNQELEIALTELGGQTKALVNQAKRVHAMMEDERLVSSLSLENACKIGKSIEYLTELTSFVGEVKKNFNNVTLKSILDRIKDLADVEAQASSESSGIGKLLANFDDEVKDIIGGVLSEAKPANVLRRVAEECYKQAISPDGNLYIIDPPSLSQTATVEVPSGHDPEREESSARKDQHQIGKTVDQPLRPKVATNSLCGKSPANIWLDFWFGVLNNVPGGPTLFRPLAGPITEKENEQNVPRYLFRTFDPSSTGRNDEHAISSTEIANEPRSRVDILSMDKVQGTKMLYTHLNKPNLLESELQFDNMMSWTSSFLFAVQYALWRHRYRNNRPSELKICVAVTSKFPPGQFMRDLSLIETFRGTAGQSSREARFFLNRHAGMNKYYNGEYLSQGTVLLTDRAYVISLQGLKDAGLLDLYPEFIGAGSDEHWTKRASALRERWEHPQPTSDKEIESAIFIWRRCFQNLDPSEIVPLLLAFKARKFSKANSANILLHPSIQVPVWADKPIEVRRYWEIMQRVRYHIPLPFTPDLHLNLLSSTLREIFEKEMAV